MYEFKSFLDYINEVLFNLVHFNHNKDLKGDVLINQVYYTGVQAMWYVVFFSVIFSFLSSFIFG